MHRFFLVTLTLAAALVADSAHAQDWERVRALPSGAKLRILLETEIEEGRLSEATHRHIVVERRTLYRRDIRQIDRFHSRKSRGAVRGLFIGLGIGTTFGAGLGHKAAFGKMGALVGALMGIDLITPRIETVYQSRVSDGWSSRSPSHATRPTIASDAGPQPTQHTGPSAANPN